MVQKSLTVIIPVYNEYENLNNIYEVYNRLLKSKIEFQVIIVESGSTDNSKKYLETVDKILQLGGFVIWIPTKDGKYKIQIKDVDKDTLKVTYLISDKNWDMNVKRGITDIDSLYNLLYQQSMWSPKEFREHFLRFLSDSVI
jgi:glycosyltransferase involved in cell wall biosynthesis